MPHTALAQSTQTPYRVTLTDPQGHTWYVDEPAAKGGKIARQIQCSFCSRARRLHHSHFANVCQQ